MLAQAEMLVVFVLGETISQGLYIYYKVTAEKTAKAYAMLEYS